MQIYLQFLEAYQGKPETKSIRNVSVCTSLLQYVDLTQLHPCLADLELKLPTFAAHRIRRLQTPRQLIVELDSRPSEVSPLRHDDDVKPFVFRSLSPMSVVSRLYLLT